jgi:glycosyltransferase involved in cell wall biosynthesis
MAELLAAGVDLELTLVGDDASESSAGDMVHGNQRAVVEELVRAHRLEGRVRLEGYQPEARLPAYYAACHVVALLALPGLHFGLPNVLVEAMASARPFLGTALPAVELQLGSSGAGVIVPGQSEDEIRAGAVAALRRLAADPALRRAMGERGREQARLWDQRVSGAELLRLLEGAARERPASERPAA